MDKPTCATCPYYHPHQGSEDKSPPDELVSHTNSPADCRRRPPTCANLLLVESVVTVRVREFPPTRPDDWCGEHPDFPAWLSAQSDTPSRHEPEAVERDKNGRRVCPKCARLMSLPDPYDATDAARAEAARYRAALREINNAPIVTTPDELRVIAYRALHPEAPDA